MESEQLPERQILQCVAGPGTQTHPSRSFGWIIQLFCLGSWILPRQLFHCSFLPPGIARCCVTMFGVHSEEKMWLSPLAPDPVQSWTSVVPLLLSSRFFYKGTQTSALLLTARAWAELAAAFTGSLLLGSQLLVKRRHKPALFSKTFSISGGRQSTTAGTTAALG